MQRFEFQIDENSHKKRLEDFLLERFRNLSKMYLRETVKNERCEVNGRFENRGYLLRTNDFVEIEVDISRENSMKPQEIPLEIVFEDDALIVVNKPAGMLVHPTHADKNGTLLNALTFYLNAECGMRNAEYEIQNSKFEIRNSSDEQQTNSAFRTPHSAFTRAGLIHRLDKQTSGLLVIAKQSRAHRILCEHFKRKLVEKKYLALVEGVVEKDEGTINAPIGRFAEMKLWNVKTDGKPAETRFRVKERFVDTTLLELEPVTGRTNQLRIHCVHIGHPIIGDYRYNGREFARLCLHAYKLGFHHPNGGKWMEFETKSKELF